MQNAPQITIEGIKFRNFAFKKPEIITFLDGGIGKPYVTISIIAPRGEYIDCIFVFYVSNRMNDDTPKMIKEYIGAEFDFVT